MTTLPVWPMRQFVDRHGDLVVKVGQNTRAGARYHLVPFAQVLANLHHALHGQPCAFFFVVGDLTS
jgi:hypothetical protein